ncbi:hypothetical protein U0070_008770, partial [Myodes glareolus]
SARDAIQAIYAENHKLVFLQQGPLVLGVVSLTQQSAAVSGQTVSTLTHASMARIFAHKKNYDLRRLLVDSEHILDWLLDSVE